MNLVTLVEGEIRSQKIWSVGHYDEGRSWCVDVEEEREKKMVVKTERPITWGI